MRTDPTIRLGPDGESFLLALPGPSGQVHTITIPANDKGLLLLKAILHQREFFPRDQRIANPGEPIQAAVREILRNIEPGQTPQSLVEEWLANGGQITRVGKRKLPPDFSLDDLGIDVSDLTFGDLP